MNARRGSSSIGCLFTLLVVVAVVYFGIHVAEVYWRYYEFLDDFKQEVRFSGSTTNEKILTRLRARADSLDLPEDARDITIRRTAKGISIDAEYYERIELPMYARDVLFHPHAEGSP